MEKTRKVLFVGNSNSGKSLTVSRLLGYECPKQQTLGCEVWNFANFQIWDMAGDDKLCLMKQHYYQGAEKIVVFEGGIGSKTTQDWIEEAKRNCPYASIIVRKKLKTT